MHEHQKPQPIEVIFEDQVTLSDGRSKPYLVSLQLTSESLIIRPINTNKVSSPRNVTIERDPITRSLGFSIKGGRDTGKKKIYDIQRKSYLCFFRIGFPVLISRVIDTNSHLIQIGDAILNINNDDISDLTHDQVITKLRDVPGDKVNLTIQYMNDMATYLCITTPKLRSSLTTIKQNSLTLPRVSSANIRRNRNRLSAQYSSEYRSNIKQQRLSLAITDQREVREYPLLYAYVTQYLNGTDKLRINSFELYTSNGSRTGIIITNTSTEQNMWISRINMVIRHLTTRTLAELNQTFLSSEQVFYASWIHERIVNFNENHLPEWKAIFIVFKGSDLYIFDENKSPPLCAYDFICCKRVYSIIEVFIETVLLKSYIDDRRYCFTLTLPNDLINQYRYLNFERKTEYEDFILNYQRSLYISVYSIQNRTFGCLYQGQICRLIIDINKGFEMYNNETNIMLWTFTFEQLQSSSDNGRDKIYFQFKPYSNEKIIHIEVQCQHLRILIHVINAFLTIKFIGQRDDMIE